MVQHQPRVVHGLNRVVTLGGDPAGVIPAVIHRGDLLEIAGDAVWFAKLGSLGQQQKIIAGSRGVPQVRGTNLELPIDAHTNWASGPLVWTSMLLALTLVVMQMNGIHRSVMSVSAPNAF